MILAHETVTLFSLCGVIVVFTITQTISSMFPRSLIVAVADKFLIFCPQISIARTTNVLNPTELASVLSDLCLLEVAQDIFQDFPEI